MSLDSPEVQALLSSDKEEEPPFPGARRILNWEQRIVRSRYAHLLAEQPCVLSCSTGKPLHNLHVLSAAQTEAALYLLFFSSFSLLNDGIR